MDCPRCEISYESVEFMAEVKQIVGLGSERGKTFEVHHIFHCTGCLATWSKVVSKEKLLYEGGATNE